MDLDPILGGGFDRDLDPFKKDFPKHWSKHTDARVVLWSKLATLAPENLLLES